MLRVIIHSGPTMAMIAAKCPRIKVWHISHLLRTCALVDDDRLLFR